MSPTAPEKGNKDEEEPPSSPPPWYQPESGVPVPDEKQGAGEDRSPIADE
jgi:hypothetical protein